MHKNVWRQGIIAIAGVGVSTQWGADIATLFLAMIEGIAGHPLATETAQALTRLVSGFVVGAPTVAYAIFRKDDPEPETKP